MAPRKNKSITTVRLPSVADKPESLRIYGCRVYFGELQPFHVPAAFPPPHLLHLNQLRHEHSDA